MPTHTLVGFVVLPKLLKATRVKEMELSIYEPKRSDENQAAFEVFRAAQKRTTSPKMVLMKEYKTNKDFFF